MPGSPIDDGGDGSATDGTTATSPPEGQGTTGSECGNSNPPSVHRPGDGEPLATDTPRTDREFGREGWALVVGIVIAFLVVPALIYWRPPALPFEVAFLILPLLPAVLLALLAVWVTTTT